MTLAKIREKQMLLQVENGNEDENKAEDDDDEKVDVTLKARKKFAYIECMISNYKENMS